MISELHSQYSQPDPLVKISQPDLFAGDSTIKRRPTLAERYQAWRQTEHGKEVFHLAMTEAISAVEAGFGHYSIDLITSVIRHRHNLAHKPDDGSLIFNNSFRPQLARELMETDDRLSGFFETRQQKPKHKTPIETPNRVRGVGRRLA